MESRSSNIDRLLVTGGGLLGPPRLDEALLGERVGAFELTDILGRGGMSTVYLGERHGADFAQTAAIKVLEARTSRAAADGFRRERRILARLDHPGIARIFDGGTLPDGRLFLVMEYVAGDPVDVHCRRVEAGLDERLDLFEQVCAALGTAHEEGVWHHDLKPENILVDRHGHAKLLDFGIARVALEPDPDAEVPLLTPRFAAPEQFRGRAAGASTDVFQLGVLLYLLACDRHPAGAATDAASLEAAVTHLPQTPASQAPVPWQARLDGDFDRIVATALAGTPQARYRSVEALLEDLRAWRAGLRSSVGTRGTWAAARRFWRRHPVAIGSGLALAVVVLGAGYGAWDALQREQARSEAMTELVSSVVRAEAPDPERITTSSFELNDDTITDDPKLRRELAQVYAEALLDAGRHEQAARIIESVLGFGPRGFESSGANAALYGLLGECYRRSGRWEEARAYLRMAHGELSPREADQAERWLAALRGLAAIAIDNQDPVTALGLYRESAAALRSGSALLGPVSAELATLASLADGQCPRAGAPPLPDSPLAAAVARRCPKPADDERT